MNLRQARLKMIKAFDGGWDAMAAALGMTRDGLENRIYEKKGQSVLTETDLQMQAMSHTTYFAQAVATASGGTFVQLPAPDDLDNDALMNKFHELHAELGELHHKFREYTKNNEVDARERADLQEIGGRIHMKMQELLVLTFRIYCKDGVPPADA